MCSSDLPDLTSLPRLADTVRAAGLVPDRRLGQHFLLDPQILAAIVRAAGDLSGRPVLEIGPGPGGLTRALLAAGARVTAVERDPRAIRALEPLLHAACGRLRLVEADALALEPDRLMEGGSYAIVANLPYNIGTELLLRWLLDARRVTAMHLMFQREVALRLTAEAGTAAYGRLTVLARTLCDVRRTLDLPPGAFSPPPRVHSSLVSLEPFAERPDDPLIEALQRVTAAAFQQRRKMLRSSLKGMGVPVEQLLGPLGIAPTARAETLDVATFLRMAQRLIELRAATSETISTKRAR